MPDEAVGDAATVPNPNETFVLDTCALLDGFDETLEPHQVIILEPVLAELDAQKDSGRKISFAARTVLKRIRDRGYVVAWASEDLADDAVAAGNYRLSSDWLTPRIGTPVSSDVTVEIKAQGRCLNHRKGVPEVIVAKTSDVYEDILVDAASVNTLYSQGLVPCDLPGPIRARFVSPSGTALAWVADGFATLVSPKQEVMGVKPLDAAQAFALDALQDEDIDLVCLTGVAGTGKTYLTMAAALAAQQGGEASTLYAIRPLVPVGQELGFLPGTKDEKMSPWAQVVWDTASLLDPECTMASIMGERSKYDIKVEPTTYMRGRSIPNAIIWVDEAQNLDLHELKTMLTRAGEGTKVILTGDVDQIDRKDLNSRTNGLSCVMREFETWSNFRHVHLTKNCRSRLAAEAAKRLG